MDLTGWCIASGLLGAVPHAVVKMLRHKSMDIAGLVTLFLGMFSVPLAGASIKAAIVGDPTQLPSNWRELLAVAGVVALALTFRFVLNAYVALKRTPSPVPGPLQLDSEGADGELRP